MGETEATTEETQVEETQETAETVETETAETEATEAEVEVPAGAENEDAVKNLIKAERKKARDAYAKARDLERQIAERDEAELPAEERIAAADARAEAAELKALRLEVALEAEVDPKIAPKFAERLTGKTREELVADATDLLSLVPKAPAAGLEGGYRQTQAPKAPPEKAHNELVAALLQRAGQQ